MFVAYTATFISFLTVTHYHMPFKDFQGILDDGTYRLGILASAASINYFKFSPDAVLRQIYQKLLRPYVKEHPLTDFDGLKKLCTEKKYAYITMDVAYRHIVTKLPCETVHVPNAYFGMLIATTLRKNHPFRRVFDLRVCELLAAGIVQRIEENAVPRKMTENIEDQDTGATLEETFIIFLILIIGVCISVLILFIEIVTLKL
ncbi:glutamate receptor 3-like [Periplaneta americana]|uniref:glutamate receptor 3-like n=1 Tax=Periplaneta americana TaxID=6978 RepID=UPI0037E9C25B